MGSCGLVGQIGTYNAMKSEFTPTYILSSIVGLQIVAPAILSYIFYVVMKKKDWIKDGDLKIF